MHALMDKNLFSMEVPGVCLMFIVLRFHSLVDYLTSFSGVALSFLFQDVLSFLCQADSLAIK